MSGSACHPAAGVGPRTAHVEPLYGSPVGPVAQHRPGGPQLVQTHVAMHDIASDQPELPVEPFGTENLSPQDGGAEAWRDGLDRIDYGIGCSILFIVPIAAIGEFGRELLAKQARHMLACRSQTIVDRAGDEHFDDRFLGPALGLGIEERPVHVIQCRGENDTRPVVLTRMRERGKRR